MKAIWDELCAKLNDLGLGMKGVGKVAIGK